jgi:hypothetical protein
MQISILPVTDTLKSTRRFYTKYKEVLTVAFEDMPKLIASNSNYSPFVYKDNTRLKENIISNTSMVILDVDVTNVPIHDMHIYLKNELKTHIVSTTSNSNNLLKYRILMPLSREVTKEEYPNLVRGITEYGLVPSTDLQGSKNPSQTFYAYANSSIILTYFDGELLHVEDYLLNPVKYPVKANLIIKDCVSIVETFKSPKNQKGNSTLVAASFALLKAGYTYTEYVKCIKQVNNAWVFPMDEDRLYTTIVNPFKKKFNR